MAQVLMRCGVQRWVIARQSFDDRSCLVERHAGSKRYIEVPTAVGGLVFNPSEARVEEKTLDGKNIGRDPCFAAWHRGVEIQADGCAGAIAPVNQDCGRLGWTRRRQIPFEFLWIVLSGIA